jgi:hypothetical protein
MGLVNENRRLHRGDVAFRKICWEIRAIRGLDHILATSFVAADGDLGRVENSRRLMAYLNL